MTRAKKQSAEVVPIEKAKDVAPISEAASLMQVIERAVLNPDFDVAKMRALVEMRTEILAQEAKQAFAEAMAAAQGELEPVVRDAPNPQTKSKYARLETISKAITPIVSRHGFSTSFGQADSPKENHLRVVGTLYHAQGHEREYHVDIPIDKAGIQGKTNKTDTWAFGSTLSYGRRYLKLLMFDIAMANEDNDGNSEEHPDGNEPISSKQVDELVKLADETGTDKGRFCEYHKIASFKDILQRDFEQAKLRMNLAAKKRKEVAAAK